jgi:acyl carrier protein
MYQELIDLITGVATEMNTIQESQIAIERGADAPLYGREGVLDSLGLVTFVVAVEEAIEDQLNASIVLADEKAMSQHSSPFLTIGSLAAYADKLIEEATANA